ncbi:MAG: hypothetical protein ABIP55_06720 [Tepidisphaeraceae bacterium]
MRIARLFAKNLGLTAAGIVVCVLIGLPIAYTVAGMREPDAAKFVARGGSVDTRSLDRFYQTRDSITWFAAWCGLISAQTVFATLHFSGREPAPPVGGFPVKEF